MKRKINVSKLEKERVIIEKSEEFKDSAFNVIYDRVAVLIEKIIDKNEDIDRDRDNKTEIDNIISFEGRRGTGKTSAMMSVYHSMKYSGGLLKKEKIENVSFTVIDYIDASMLERGEEILEIILANMFHTLKEHDLQHSQERPTNDGRKIYKLFDEIYGNLMDIKSLDRRKEEISPLSLLNKLSNSQILKNRIRELVQLYLEYMSNNDNRYDRNRKRFLVIAVDDIDMHFQGKEASPFEMLETLHRYFMIPGVIILLTYNYSDLCLGCQKHFGQIYYTAGAGLGTDEKDYVQELTVQYLKKVLPIYTRVHMPSLKKRDYGDDNAFVVVIKKDKMKDLFDSFAESLMESISAEEIELMPKRFMLLLKASVAGLYYDSMGIKRHFAEPTSLRDLAQMYVFYKNLKSIESNNENLQNILFKEILDDLYFRYARVYLKPSEQEKFNRYLEVTVKRRGRDILEHLHEFAQKENIQLSDIDYRDSAERSYSYGELVHGLYKASRCGWFSKELVCCILDSYTVVLTKLYREFVDKNECRKCHSKILEVIGASVAGSWSNKFVPEVKVRNISEADEFGIFPWDKDSTEGASIKFGGSAVRWEIPLKPVSSMPEIKEQLQLLEILCMLFTDVSHRELGKIPEKGFSFTYGPGNGEFKNALQAESDKHYEAVPIFTIEFSDGCFNIMNFVNNLFDGERFFEQLHENLRDAFTEYLNDIRIVGARKRRRYTEEKTVQFFEENSLKNEYRHWNENSHGMAMPIYSFDMMYNIMKRQYQNHRVIQETVDVTDFWIYVKNVYDGIGELLKKEDEFYFSNADGIMQNERYKFYNAYQDSPFISWITMIETDLEKREWFKEQFAQMILSLAQI